MYTLIKTHGIQEALRKETASMVFSMAVAELLFHFHSFTLECVSFLATWYCVSYATDYVKSRVISQR